MAYHLIRSLAVVMVAAAATAVVAAAPLAAAPPPAAQTAAPAQPPAEQPPADQPKKYHAVEAEVVSASVDDMTITFKVAGEQKTAHVSPLARARAAAVKPGDKVVLTCKDLDGEHKEVVAIRAPRAAAK